MQYIQLQSQNPNTLPLPIDGFNIFIDQTDNTLKIKNSDGEVYGGDNYNEITYSGLVDTITTSGLSAGSFYMITDFRTCYDQPDFNSFGNSITTGNYKQAAIEPIVVFATSVSTISVDAYQPTYPNDKIQYDWTYSGTETTNGVAYGRISERIDEFNNRTDYDHRTILFKRYRLYTHRQGQPLNGSIELFSDGSVSGTSTSFDSLNVGDVIYIPDLNISYYEITGITNNTSMGVSGDTILADGGGLQFYKAIEETNDIDGYFSYKRTNVKTNDFVEYTTFGNAISDSYAKNNYVGNYANIYTTLERPFLLANNVFLEGSYQTNKFGDYCHNNTFGTDNSNNIWGDWCYGNVSTNDIDDNIIGHYFYDNLMNVNLDNNHIGNNFYNNRLLAENNQAFKDNIIGNDFNNNTIYSWFYDNQIGNRFESNTIGDFGNLDNLEFHRNVILNDFNQNIIRKDFQNNQIGNQFNENVVNGDFYENIISNGFYFNKNIGHNFYGNHIGNGFNQNDVIGDYFQDNQIGEYFNSNNNISYFFKDNKIGNQFENNTLGNSVYFNWDNTTIENLTGRTYNTFYNSLFGSEGNNVDNLILGKEFIMHDTVNDEYHKVKFTQWTLNGNGGGFSYERTKVYPTVEPTVYFTKPNYGNEVDIIVEGSLEITRGNNGAIYNQADEASWDSNQSPVGTQWNSIYTQSEEINGANFENNNIGDDFKGNFILSYFELNNVKTFVISNVFSGSTGANEIGSYTLDNNFLGDVYGNSWIGGFYFNNIGDGFYINNFYSNVNNNTIGNGFTYNNVNTNINDIDFTVNLGNITGFTYNSIGTTATDDTYTGLAGVTNGNGVNATFDIEVSGGTVIGVSGNSEGKLFMYGNTITILGTQIGGYSNAIDSITSDGVGKNGLDGTYNGLAVTGGNGTNATFDVSVNGGLVDGVLINNRGNGYEINDELILIGSLFGGTDGVDDITITVIALFDDDVVITVSGVTKPSVYETYNTTIFERKGGDKRLSFYDENDILTITNINE